MYKNTLKKPNSQLHPNSLSPTRQEKNTILSFYAAARLLGIISNYLLHLFLYITNLIYIYICVSACTRNHNPSWIRFPNIACIWFRRIIGLGNSSHTRPTSTWGLFIGTLIPSQWALVLKLVLSRASQAYCVSGPS